MFRLLAALLVAALIPAGLALAAGDKTVTASGDDFAPKAITITAGDKVTWKNQDGLHNVVFDDGSYRSGKPTTDKTLGSHRFTTPGTFTYHCEIHVSSGMTGTVTVEAADPNAPPKPEFDTIAFTKKVTGGKLRGTVTGTAGADLKVKATLRGDAVGRTAKTLSDAPAKLAIPLRRSVRKALAKGRHPQVTVTLQLSSDAGTTSATRRVRLTR